MAARLAEVRLAGYSGRDLLTMSSSRFDPFETLVFRPRPRRSGGIQSIIRRHARALGDTLYQHSIARQMLAEPGQHVGVKLVTTEVVHRLVADAVVEDVRHVPHAVLPIAVD